MTTLSIDGLLAVAEQLNVQTLPGVLNVRPQQDSYRAWHTARAHALSELRAGEVLDAEGEVDPGVADALFVLAQPERELIARVHTEETGARVSVAGRGGRYAVAKRIGDRFDIGLVWSDGSPATLAAPLLSALGPAEPARIPGFSVPTTDLAERLNAAHSPSEYTDALYALGLDSHEATVLGAAFGSCRTVTEIVAYAYGDGSAIRAPGAVAVYDTARGRVVAAPMVSPDRQIWSTVTTGTDHRVTQAVAALLEGLPVGRWPATQLPQ